MGALKSCYIWGTEILKTERENQKKKKWKDVFKIKAKEWQGEEIVLPCQPRMDVILEIFILS